MIKSNGNIVLSNSKKEEMISAATEKYGEFLTSLGFDWKNDIQMKGTPKRVAKMYVNELFEGCYNVEPTITAFNNKDIDEEEESQLSYDGIVFVGNIKLHSVCAHHIVPFMGVCHVAYLPNVDGNLVGVSKLNRIVEYFCRRPQIQENLTMQIHNYLNKVLGKNNGIAVVIKADHLCVRLRGVKHDSTMITNKLSGDFLEQYGAPRQEFYSNINML